MAWKTRALHAGQFQPITDLIKAGSHVVEIWGNGDDGWQLYLVDTKQWVGEVVSPYFHRDFGDTMRDLKEATERAFGVTPRKGRGWL